MQRKSVWMPILEDAAQSVVGVPVQLCIIRVCKWLDIQVLSPLLSCEVVTNSTDVGSVVSLGVNVSLSVDSRR